MRVHTGSILALATGILFPQFDDMHKLAEFVCGRPIWTHEFANRKLANALKQWAWNAFPWSKEWDAMIQPETNERGGLTVERAEEILLLVVNDVGEWHEVEIPQVPVNDPGMKETWTILKGKDVVLVISPD